MKNIHDYLQTIKVRVLILLPPAFMCITGFGFIFAHSVMNFSFFIPKYVCYIYIISSIYLLIGVGIILWSDSKK